MSLLGAHFLCPPLTLGLLGSNWCWARGLHFESCTYSYAALSVRARPWEFFFFFFLRRIVHSRYEYFFMIFFFNSVEISGKVEEYFRIH